MQDGKFVTSSGVSAGKQMSKVEIVCISSPQPDDGSFLLFPLGIDAALYIVSELKGIEIAEKVSREIEYTWHRNADEDPFADMYDYTRQG